MHISYTKQAANAVRYAAKKAKEMKHPYIGTEHLEFAQIVSKDTIRMRVWERGSGITQACGTGACAKRR